MKSPYINRKTNRRQKDPSIWGPYLWYSIHNGVSYYPYEPSYIQKQRMKYFIIGLPMIIPCDICREHATNFIEIYRNENLLDQICDTKNNLIIFFYKFHNMVNSRDNKPELTIAEFKKIYPF